MEQHFPLPGREPPDESWMIQSSDFINQIYCSRATFPNYGLKEFTLLEDRMVTVFVSIFTNNAVITF